MRRTLPVLLIAFIVPMATASAKDRPITDQERPKLEAAVKEAGCSGGKMEFDDDKGPSLPAGKFEIDDATCQDGKKYDLTFDPEMKLLTKKLD